MSAKQRVDVEVAGRTLSVSSPDKVFFSRGGQTKLDLIGYYLALEKPVMAAMGGRPVLLERYPDGASGKSFFQKRIPKGAPEWLETTVVSTPNGTTSNALVVADLAHLAWAVNMGTIPIHPWPYRASEPEVTDQLRIDLDPQPGLTFDHVRTAAHRVKDLLDEVGIASFVKTTGSRGLHIYASLRPQWDSYAVRAGAVALARELERRHPRELTAAWWKEERGDRVFVDFNQNCPHKTVFGAWCVRARVGAQVSTPIAWTEVDTIDPASLTIDTVPRRVADHGDPWATIDDEPQDLSPLLALHEADMAAGLMDAPWPPVYPKQPNEPPRVAPSRAKTPPQAP